MWGYSLLEKRIRRKARPSIVYDFACEEAKAGRHENALILLEQAVAAGFRNFEHIRQDPDLEGLREKEAFRRLLDS